MNPCRAVLTAMPFVVLASLPPAHAQVPLSATKIPQFVQPLDLLSLQAKQVPVALGIDGTTNIDLSICEFRTSILPPGTPVVGATKKSTTAPLTYVWGYQKGTTCNPLPGHSYIGPVVVAKRGTPTQITFWNQLPGAQEAKVTAYSWSTDQTLIWGDPLSLDTASGRPRMDGAQTYLYDPNVVQQRPETNECWAAAQALAPGAALPPACLNNYGFSPDGTTYTAPVPAAVHLHGGEVPAALDGGPDSWWTKTGFFGHGYYSRGGFADAALGKAVYNYPNGQEAAPIWFHDHMLGATRLNVYAGIAGAYMIAENPLAKGGNLAPGLLDLGLDRDGNGALDTASTPSGALADEALVPLVIQDRMFDTRGELFFPNVGINPEHPFWVPEFVGDVIVVNGKAWPYLNVEPKRYRFLFLNGSNARAYELFLVSKTTGLKGPSLWVIGNDQGYLDAPMEINPNLKPFDKLVMMPGERYEVIVDFSSVAGQVIEMQNTARTPYVAGAPANGNTTGRIIRFNVSAAPIVDNSFNPAAPGAFIRAKVVQDPKQGTLTIPNPMVRLTAPLGTTVAGNVTVHKTRRLTVNEVVGPGGPLEVLVNNTLYDGSKNRGQYLGYPSGESDFKPVTTEWNTSYYSELPHEGETELWEIVNLTADAHPMHPHLVAFQVLNRQPLDVKAYMAAYNAEYALKGMPLDGYGPPLDYNCGLGAPGRGVVDPATCVLGGNPDPVAVGAALLGTEVPPRPQEIGWKDTVQALPNMITRVLVRFAKADLPADTSSDSAGYDFSPNHGHGYVFHCHIVDHEDNEMMRPYSVQEYPRSRSFTQGIDY